jgi:hypothetical protein
MITLTRTAIVFLVLLFAAQATADAQGATKRTRDRNTLTTEEIEGSTASSVFQLIQQKRPRWLSPRGSSTLRTQTGTDALGRSYEAPADPEIAVYVDDVKYGTQEVLRSMPPHTVESMEYLDAASATQRFGTNHEYGAILVRRKGR